jgi:hypothetical protein
MYPWQLGILFEFVKAEAGLPSVVDGGVRLVEASSDESGGEIGKVAVGGDDARIAWRAVGTESTQGRSLTAAALVGAALIGTAYKQAVIVVY